MWEQVRVKVSGVHYLCLGGKYGITDLKQPELVLEMETFIWYCFWGVPFGIVVSLFNHRLPVAKDSCECDPTQNCKVI